MSKILEYNLTDSEKEFLFLSWIINWCGWKWWTNFDKIIKDNITVIPWFDKKKANKLYKNIRSICYEHDIDFRFKRWFYKSNYKMAKKLYKLLFWAKFTHRMSLFFICFYLLCKYGKRFYYIKKK